MAQLQYIPVAHKKMVGIATHQVKQGEKHESMFNK
jgi:hypothetical protein